MNHDRSRRPHALLAGVAFAILACVSLAARAQAVDDTAGPVRLVVPFAAGGPADTLARTLAPRLSEQLKQTVVVDNRPGAGGTIGADAVAKAAPDGHTLLVSTSSTHGIAPVLYPRLPYDAEADFTPIAALADAPGIVLVPRDAPARTLREFVELARREPGRLSYGSSGNGTIVHLATELFKAETGTYLVHIPYRGTAQAMSDLIAGTIDVLFDSLVTGLPQVRDGKVRALAVTSLRRTPLAPDVPPVADLVPGYEAVTCFGLYGPRGLAHDSVARLNRAVNTVLGDAGIRERLARLGAEPTGGEPHDLSDRMRAETAKWRRIVRERDIRTD